MLDFDHFRVNSQFFRGRGGDSPPLETHPRVRAPAVPDPAFLLPLLFVFGIYTVFSLFCLRFYTLNIMSFNTLNTDDATVASTTSQTHISKDFSLLFIKFTHHFPLCFCHLLPNFLTFSPILSIFYRFLLL